MTQLEDASANDFAAVILQPWEFRLIDPHRG